MVSLKDIAAACGVSAATVSKALNNMPDISEETKLVVKDKAKEMGYFPNLAARTLKTNRSYNIGILFTDETNSGLTHPHFAEVLESFKIQAESRGYDITFINNSSMAGQTQMTYYEHCRYRGVDGVVIACIDFQRKEVLELINSDMKIVTIDHIFNNSSSIISDNVQGMKEMMEYILDQGHTRIAYIHGNNSAVTRDRLASFYRTMEERGIEVREEYILEGKYNDPVKCSTITEKLLKLPEPPTCILYPDDYASIGGINVIRKAGLKIPDDISVAGYDGIPMMRVMEPALTTVSQDRELLGKKAANQLIRLIERPKTTLQKIQTIPSKLYKGSTVKNIN
jgi:DNA-binding LacI/PurR family transcriptional regulator